MNLCYLGHSSFRLVDEAGTSVVTDPYGEVGFCMPSVSASVVTVSHSHYDHCAAELVQGNPAVLSSAGNFAVKSLTFSAIPCLHDNAGGRLRGKNLIFKMKVDGIDVCHLGDLGEDFNAALAQKILPVQVLLIPVGGRYTIDAGEAKKYVDYLKPAVVIPMHYKTEGLDIDIAGVEGFLRLFSSDKADIVFSGQDTITLNKADFSGDKLKIIVMERKHDGR